MKRRKVKPPFKLIIAVIFIFLVIGFSAGYIRRILMRADYFKIKEIIVRDDSGINSERFSYLRGKNIFAINLEGESRYILESYPGYSRVDLFRVLPNRIYADFVSRKPIALIKLYKYFAVDNLGVLFDIDAQSFDPELAVITGLETKIFGPRPGKKYEIKELNLALSIIREFKANPILKKCRIKKINVSNIAESSLFIPLAIKSLPASNLRPAVGPSEYLLEVKTGEDNIKEKVVILAGLMLQTKNDLVNMRYIDLRFKEPVIKLKDKK